MNSGESLFLVQYDFTVLVEWIFNCVKIQNTGLTPAKILNIFIYVSFFVLLYTRVTNF